MNLRQLGRRLLAGYQFYVLAGAVNLLTWMLVVAYQTGMLIATIEVGTTAFLSLGFVYVGYQLSTSDFTVDDRLQVTGGAFVFGTIAMVIAAILYANQVIAGVEIGHGTYLIFLAWTWGAAFGSPLSYYHVRIHQQNEELLESLTESRRLSRQLSISQRVMRHNLRNDLTIIKGHTDELLRRSPGKEQVEALEAIEGVAQRLQSTMETFLQMQNAIEDETRTEFELGAVIRSICRDPTIANEPVAVSLDLPSSATVTAHELLPEAIRELVMNAIEHNDPTDLELAISVRPALGADESVELVIEDNGTGLHPEQRQPIEGTQETPLEHPDGMGLWFVRIVVEESGGAIAVDEGSAGGTRFRVELPTPARGPP